MPWRYTKGGEWWLLLNFDLMSTPDLTKVDHKRCKFSKLKASCNVFQAQARLGCGCCFIFERSLDKGVYWWHWVWAYGVCDDFAARVLPTVLLLQWKLREYHPRGPQQFWRNRTKDDQKGRVAWRCTCHKGMFLTERCEEGMIREANFCWWFKLRARYFCDGFISTAWFKAPQFLFVNMRCFCQYCLETSVYVDARRPAVMPGCGTIRKLLRMPPAPNLKSCLVVCRLYHKVRYTMYFSRVPNPQYCMRQGLSWMLWIPSLRVNAWMDLQL